MNLDNCRECEESRCILSTYYNKSLEEIEYTKQVKEAEKERIKELKIEAIYQKKLKDDYNRKSKAYYLKEKKYYEKVLKREDELTNYKRMNEIDRIHQNIWDLTIIQLMELQEKYYSNIKY